MLFGIVVESLGGIIRSETINASARYINHKIRVVRGVLLYALQKWKTFTAAVQRVWAENKGSIPFVGHLLVGGRLVAADIAIPPAPVVGGVPSESGHGEVGAAAAAAESGHIEVGAAAAAAAVPAAVPVQPSTTKGAGKVRKARTNKHKTRKAGR